MSEAKSKRLKRRSTSSRRREKDLRVGEIAIYNGLLDTDQVEEALAIQKDMAGRGYAMKIGKVLIEKYFLDRPSLTAILKAQAGNRGLSPDTVDTSVLIFKFTLAEHENLVTRVRDEKLVEPSLIDEAFQLQASLEERGIDKQLGEIMVEKGWLSRRALRDILDKHPTSRMRRVPGTVRRALSQSTEEALSDSSLQELLCEGGASVTLQAAEKLLFGHLAVEKRLVSVAQVRECLVIQFRLKPLGIQKRIGKILVEKGYIRRSDSRRILQLQKQRWGQIQWADLAHTQNIKPEDALLARVLLEGAILDAEQIDECRFVQRAMIDLGLDRTLAQVIVEKEYLSSDILNGIWKEHQRKSKEAKEAAAAAEGPEQVGEHQLKSVALTQAYEEILSRYREEPPESQETEEGLVVVRTGGAVRPRAIQSTSARRPRVGLWLGAAAILALGVAGGAFLFARERYRARVAEGPGEPAGPVVVGPAASAPGEDPADPAPPPVRIDPGPEPPPGASEVDTAVGALKSSVSEELAVRLLPVSRSVHIVVAGVAKYPPGTILTIELELGGMVADRQIARLETDRFGVAFGPYSIDPPGRERVGPWILAGTYHVRAMVRPPADEEWRRAVEAAGLVVEGEAARVRLDYPSPEDLEVRRKEQKEFVTKGLTQVYRGIRALAVEVEQVSADFAVGKVDGAGERLARLRSALGDSRRTFDDVRSIFLALPDPVLFGQVSDLHDALLAVCATLSETVSELRVEPAVAALRATGSREKADSLVRSLDFQLPDGK